MATTTPAKENIGKALGLFLEAFRLYTVSVLRQTHGKDEWENRFVNDLLPDQQRNWDRGISQGSAPEKLIDFGHLKNFAIKNKDLLKDDFSRNVNKLPTWFEEIAEVRNKTHHYAGELDDLDVSRTYSNMVLIARAIKMKELEDELNRLQQANQPIIEEKPKKKSAVTASAPLSWFHVVRPQFDIRQGKLDESVFAANVAEVALGAGPEVYQNASLFFSKTFFTQGLRTVARRVIKGLNGEEDAENRVVSLQTGFGGGKTHILISLFHLAKSGRKASDVLIKELFASTAIPAFDQANIAVFTNTTNDPTQGRTTSTGIRIRTMWGELAYQLGGAEAYEIIRENDESRTAPAGLFKKVLVHCKPALILVDELADYCVKASAQQVVASNLSDQTISFIQELSEAVAATNNCVLVATLPASVTEVASSPQAGQILTSLQNRLGRVGADTKPVADDEIYEVIRRRLFDDLINTEAIDQVLDSYNSLYQELKGELPAHATRSDYKERLRKSYPFHPELIDVFKVRWASHHDFQRTRGVLRLLASIVSDLWKRQHNLIGKNLLIHTGDVNFENLDALTGQLKKLYGNGYAAVISADVSGSSSNAHRADDEKPEFGNSNLTKSIASTILLSSFGSDGPNKGTTVSDIKLSVMKPNDFSHFTVNAALQELEGRAHFLYYSSTGASGKRYWFHTKPNINILITQAKNDILAHEVDAEIERRLKQRTDGVTAFRVMVNPGDEIPELMRPSLIILPPKYSANPTVINGNTKPVIEKIATKKGNSERKYRNTILFLICSENAIGKLQSDVKDYLACVKIRQEYSTQLEMEQKQEIQKRMEEANRQTESSIVVAYSIIVKHTSKGIEKLILNQGEFRDNIDAQISTNILQRLKDEEWLLSAVGLGLLRSNNLVPTPETPIKANDVYESFLRFDDKPMITGVDAIKSSLDRYCGQGEFAIATGDGKTFTSVYYRVPVPYFEVSDLNFWLVDKSLYRPEPKPEQPGGVNEPKGGDTTVVTPPLVPVPGSKSLRSITVSGKVPLDQYTQIFNSFIMPLAQNNIEIEIKVKGKSTNAKPITESSQEYKIVKESARQLGLNFEEEA
jgi:predicted AAA+ superfamily ATPase